MEAIIWKDKTVTYRNKNKKVVTEKLKQNKIITQRQTLQQEVKDLQKELDIAVRTQDAFVQLELFKRLEIVKSTLLNLD